ncbi:unnamed protein product [Leptosia nina]|uniref:UDP-glucuronosyltransferase n=1 Tax=Leptosia nina TaxID=320188 RepID=A0AAV1JHY6_9NEOP
MQRVIILIISFLFVTDVFGAKILTIVPTPSISHQVVFRPLIQELARRGHQVTVITPDPAFTKENRPANLTEIDVHDVSYGIWQEAMKKQDIELGKRTGLFKMMEEMTIFFTYILEMQLRAEEVQAILSNKHEKYDLLLIEACGKPFIMFSHLIKAPVIQISSFGMMIGSEEIVGAPSHPILYPMAMRQRIYNLTFWEKLYELYTHFWVMSQWLYGETKEYEILKKYFGDDVPSYRELHKNVDMMFLNIHPMWSNNQPLPPNVISIWGIHKNPEKPLPKDLQTYLDSSKNGVIYLSFGSNAKSIMLPKEVITLLINVFSKLPYDILWKWESEELPGKSENIKVSTWLPQSDLLRHPKIKTFITQGGLQSTDEAMNAGVPLIGIPMLGDQWYNVELYEQHKIGVKLDLETLTEEQLTKAIETVITDKSYKENIVKLKNLMSDQPQTALERAVWWTEYVIRNGGAKHLRAAGANLSWTEYYEIEFITKLISLISSLILIAFATLYIIYRRIVKTFTTKVKIS